MPKIEGPMFSLSARGTYRRLITFQQRQGQAIAMAPPISRRPPSSAQQDHRHTVATMAQQWRALDQQQQAAWQQCAATLATTGYRLWWREWFAQAATPQTPPDLPCP